MAIQMADMGGDLLDAFLDIGESESSFLDDLALQEAGDEGYRENREYLMRLDSSLNPPGSDGPTPANTLINLTSCSIIWRILPLWVWKSLQLLDVSAVWAKCFLASTGVVMAVSREQIAKAVNAPKQNIDVSTLVSNLGYSSGYEIESFDTPVSNVKLPPRAA